MCVAGWFAVANAANVFRDERRLWGLAFGISLVLSIPAFVLAFRSGPRWTKTAYLVASAVALGLSIAPWHPRKRFLDAFDGLRPGMTSAEVRSRMADYAARDASLPFDGSFAFRWDRPGGAFDADLGVVRFARGRVAETTFLPD